MQLKREKKRRFLSPGIVVNIISTNMIYKPHIVHIQLIGKDENLLSNMILLLIYVQPTMDTIHTHVHNSRLSKLNTACGGKTPELIV